MKDKKKKIYFIGIKGVGLTMLAQFFAQQGHSLSGSDIPDTFLTDRVLRQAGIKVLAPFKPENIPAKLDLIIYSSAFTPENNVELAYLKNNPARFKNIPQLSYAEALGQVFNQYQGVAVCGSHGKTTTAAWLGYVLFKAGKKPNVLVGSRVPQFNGSSLLGQSKLFVAETDEYQNKLQYFKPSGVVLNNIDYDHPDFFKNATAYAKVFADFIKKIPPRGFLVVNNRDVASQKIKKFCRGQVISYDLYRFGVKADCLAANLKSKNGWQIFRVWHEGKDQGEFKIQLWGEHNILNALAVIVVARKLGVSWPEIKKNLSEFKGTERRAQILGKYRGALIIDDYAHHPTEIKATLKGLKEHYYERRLVAVFHPHTFTRTKALFKDFVGSFSSADELIVLDIYGSAREKQGGVSSRQLVQAIKKFNRRAGRKQKVKYLATLDQAAAYLREKLKPADLLLLLGAGDVFRIGGQLLKK